MQRRPTTTANTSTHSPPPLQRRIGFALIKVEEKSALRIAGWRIAGWPSARDVSRERFYNYLGWLQKSALRTWSAAARRRRRGAAALCRPDASMAPLSRFKDKLAGECCWSIPLPLASCAAEELICRRAGRGPSSGPEKLRPDEAALDLEPEAAGEGEGGRGAGVRPGCGAGVWRNVRTS